MGFKPLHFDLCVFIYFNEGRKTIIVVYVDDLTIAGIRKDLVSLVTGLNNQFTITVKGPLNWLNEFKVHNLPMALTLNSSSTSTSSWNEST